MAKKLHNCNDNGFCTIDFSSTKTNHKKSGSKKMKGKIIYFGDPMCSWCWGISKDVYKLKNEYATRLEFELVMGGLRTGGGDPWNDQMKEFLRHHWDQVHAISGQIFNFELLEWNEFNYNTEPSCRAVRIVRDIAPEKEFDFYREIQYQFYIENKDPKISDFYRSICLKLNIPYKAFRPLFLSSVYCETIKEDFLKTQKYGVRGFPSIILEYEGQQTVVSNGFSTFQEMSTRIEQEISSSIKKQNKKSIIDFFEFLNF